MRKAKRFGQYIYDPYFESKPVRSYEFRDPDKYIPPIAWFMFAVEVVLAVAVIVAWWKGLL